MEVDGSGSGSDRVVMNQISTTTWSPMTSGPEEEFANFLEFGDLQLTFPPFEDTVQDGRELEQDSGDAVDTRMGNEAGGLGLEDGQMQQEMDQHSSMRFMDGFHGSAESFHEMNMPTGLFNHQHPLQQLHGPQYRGQNIIPPTPNSIEMHGDPTRYYRPSGEPQSHVTYERFGRNQNDQVRLFSPRPKNA